MKDVDWITNVIGPLGKIHAMSAAVTNLIQKARDNDQEPEGSQISRILLSITKESYDSAKQIDPESQMVTRVQVWVDKLQSATNAEDWKAVHWVINDICAQALPEKSMKKG